MTWTDPDTAPPGAVIRDNHYYRGTLTVRVDPEDYEDHQYRRTLLEWRAYDGGLVTVDLNHDELRAINAALTTIADWQDSIDPDHTK